MSKTVGAIYYTDCRIENHPIIKICREQIKKAFKGEIVSVSLKPIELGKNIVLDLKPGVITMFKQILTALEAIDTKNVFFCEHDVLYHFSHFNFIPPRDDTFYYNTNIWQWKYLSDFVITYKSMTSLSTLCVNRKLAIKNYIKRLELIEKMGWKDDMSNPYWARKIGYEPGAKSKRQEKILKNKLEYRESECPNIDIRHSQSFTPIRVKLKNFKHQPLDWRECNIKELKNWNLQELFKQQLL